jgi:hypothetical protein
MERIITRKWLILLFALTAVVSVPSFAAKPQSKPAAPAPEVYSVKIDYTDGFIIVEGQNLDPLTAVGTIAGIPLILDDASTDAILLFSFSPLVSAAVDELGNYVVTVSTDGGSFTLTAFIPFALVTPSEPPLPGLDCPCSPEWDLLSGAASPSGFSGLEPYCSEDSASFVTVQFNDAPANNYWVLWTGWNGSAGYCETSIDSPERVLDTEEQFNACAGYLRDIVTVWGDQGNECLF